MSTIAGLHTRDETAILPTHTCFDDAMEYIQARVKETPALAWTADLKLVHGIAHYPAGQANAGEPFAHAWCEHDGLCWASGLLGKMQIYFAVAQAEYYAELRITDVTRYTVRELYDANRASGHFGPWIDRYRALCRDKP